jgi:hypothetical protein
MSSQLQTEILASVTMVDQARVRDLLALSNTDFAATLKRYEDNDEILRFDLNERPAYPLFQFDEASHRIHPTLLSLLRLRTDDWGGKIALLHWLTTPNRSLCGARPCDVLTDDADAIVSSFEAEIAELLNF